MEPLVQINQEKWPSLQDEYKKNWPYGISGYYMLETLISNPDIVSQCNIKIFSPYGDITNGLIALSTKGVYNELIILPTSKQTTLFEEALAKTKQVDWNKKMVIPFSDTPVMMMVPKLLPQVGVNLIETGPTIKHYLSKDSPLYELNSLSDVYMGPLKLKNIPQVDKVWPHRYSTSYMFFEVLIKSNLTYGLFSSVDDSLLCWLTICEVGFMTHLYCEEAHRRKGYSEYVTKFVINDQLKKGKDLFCYILENNTKSINLFRKLGFEIIGRGCWLHIMKDDNVKTKNIVACKY